MLTAILASQASAHRAWRSAHTRGHVAGTCRGEEFHALFTRRGMLRGRVSWRCWFIFLKCRGDMLHEQFTRGDRRVPLFNRCHMFPQFKLIWIQGTGRADKMSSPQQDFSWKLSVHTIEFVAGIGPRDMTLSCLSRATTWPMYVSTNNPGMNQSIIRIHSRAWSWSESKHFARFQICGYCTTHMLCSCLTHRVLTHSYWLISLNNLFFLFLILLPYLYWQSQRNLITHYNLTYWKVKDSSKDPVYTQPILVHKNHISSGTPCSEVRSTLSCETRTVLGAGKKKEKWVTA